MDEFKKMPVLHLSDSLKIKFPYEYNDERNCKIHLYDSETTVCNGNIDEVITMDHEVFSNFIRAWPRLKQILKLVYAPDFVITLYYYFEPKELLEETITATVRGSDRSLILHRRLRDLMRNTNHVEKLITLTRETCLGELSKIIPHLKQEFAYKYNKYLKMKSDEDEISSDSDELELVTTNHQRNRIVLRNRRRENQRRLLNDCQFGKIENEDEESCCCSSKSSISAENKEENITSREEN